MEALTTVGRNTEAASVATNAVARYPRSVRLRWAASDAVRRSGDPVRADGYVEDIRRMMTTGTAAVRDPATVITVGEGPACDRIPRTF